jgi:hypothetical protein
MGPVLVDDFRISCCRSWRDVRVVGEACKLGSPSPLPYLVRAQLLYLFSYDTTELLKLAVTLAHPCILS